MPWQLRSVRLRPDRDPPPCPEDDIRIILSAKSFVPEPYRGELGERAHDELVEILGDGWEPFALAPLKSGDHMMWFRRWDENKPEVTTSDLPGQYL
jgi:hypothetical protein